MIGPIGHLAGTNGTSSGEGLSFPLKGGVEAGVTARSAWFRGEGELPAAVREDLLLLVTELVNNAVSGVCVWFEIEFAA